MDGSDLDRETEELLVSHIWDSGESDYWLEVLRDCVKLQLKVPSKDLIELYTPVITPIKAYAINSLLFIDEWLTKDDLETTSDCLHLRGCAINSISPELFIALLDVINNGLFFIEVLETFQEFSYSQADKLEICSDRAKLLIESMITVNKVCRSRESLESRIGKSVKLAKAHKARKQKQHRDLAANARLYRKSKHPWDKVVILENEYFLSGVDAKDWAGRVEQRFGIPRSTYQRWREKSSQNYKRKHPKRKQSADIKPEK